MPLLLVRPQYPNQDGSVDVGSLYVGGENTYGANAGGRAGLLRFTHVDIPKGSTINAATLNMVISVKNVADAQNVVYRWYIDDTPFSKFLDHTVDELQGANNGRVWWGASTPLETVTWTPNGPARQLMVSNVKPHVEKMLSHSTWTRAGGPMTFLHSFASATQPDNFWFHLTEDGAAPILAIDYTPPASDGLETVVNLQENCNFSRKTSATGAFSMEPYFFHSVFGLYQQPAYSFVTTAAPFGDSALKVTANTTGAPTMVALGNPRLEEGEWYNYSAYVYVPDTNPNPVQLGISSDNAWSQPVTLKNQWVRVDIPFMADNNVTWALLANTPADSPVAAGHSFYVANVQLTKGRMLRPYIDGTLTKTNAVYGWAGPEGSNGYVRAVKPTVTIPATGDKSTYKTYPVDWNYTNSQGHAHHSAEFKVRKV